MTLSLGTRLGPYEITAKLGEGGMGEVYRATDTQLDRQVAIKVLPAAFTADPERLARFEREAKLLAQLHHPHIASIFGLEEAAGFRALVLELVEGPTLGDRLTAGSLPLDEALRIARQIAEALEAAHDKGIVHRDLKPQNIKAPVDGPVKVLDFGLAKAMDPLAASSTSTELAKSPTLTLGATVHGVILGTAAYMAPEQARGLPVDKRADIWAFGVVLYETLSGRRLFEGELVSDVLAAVLRQPIDWGALPADLPAAIRRLLRRCLERNPRNRLHDIADARIVIEEVLSGRGDEDATSDATATSLAAAATQARGARWPWLVLVAAALSIGIGLGLLLSRENRATEAEMRLPLALPGGWRFAEADTPLIAISRDGQRRAVAAIDESGRHVLLLGENARVDWRELPGTEGARAPFFSPDGKWIGFFNYDKLLRVALDGGPPLPVADVGNQIRGAVWLPDHSIVFSPDAGESLWRLPEEGGPRQRVTTLDPARRDRTHRWPDLLPDGSAILFTSDSTDSTEFYDDATIDAVMLATGERKTVLRGSSQARYLDPGVLVFARGGSLFAQRFDPGRLEVSGAPIPILQNVATTGASGAVQFATGLDGSLLWVPGAVDLASQLPVRIDRQGARGAPLVDRGTHTQLALSPDGRRLAVTEDDNGKIDIWIVDVERGTRSRLTFDGDAGEPTWTPDGRRVAYARSGVTPAGSSAVYWKPADGGGEAELLVGGPRQAYPGAFSPDGRTFLFERIELGASVVNELWTLELAGARRERPLLLTQGQEFGAELSPDGRWLAHVSTESGPNEIIVRPFPAGSGKWQISTAGGIEPHWSRDGRELFFRNGGTLFRTAIDTRRGFVAGPPERVATGFRPGDNNRTYSPTPDGLGFIALPGWDVGGNAEQVNLALGWRREVQRQLATQR